MSMWRKWPIVVALIVAVAGVASAQVGKSFEKAGIAIAGSGSLYFDLGPFTNSLNQYNKMTLDIDPEVDFFMIQDFALYLSPYVSWQSITYDKTDTSSTLAIGANIGVVRYFVGSPSAGSGLVPAIGVQAGFELDPGQKYLSSGTSYTDTSSTWMDVAVSARLYYFLNDSVAIYLNVVPRLWYELAASTGAGTSITLTSTSQLYANVWVGFGISYWIPRTKASLSK